MNNRLLGLFLCAALSSLAGCGPEAYLEDSGGLCTVDEDRDADEPVTFDIWLDNCISGCADNIETECSVEFDGETIRVNASATYDSRAPRPGCHGVCQPVVATCSTGPLPAGSYTVEYAGESATLDIPSSGEFSVADGCTLSSLPSSVP